MAMGSRSSGLIGLLEAWSAIEVRPTRQDWALHWSAWLGPLDAITLHGALPAIAAPRAVSAPATRTPPTAATQNLGQALQQLREDLEGFIRQGPAQPAPAPRRMAGTAPPSPVPAEDEDYGSYRQRYLDIQRRMDWRIGPFRQHCRDMLSQSHARLAQLARMDAMLEDMLGDRTHMLLAKLSALLERRFHRFRQEEGLSMADFERDFQDALVAEMHFRLEPVTGLVEAWQTGA